MCALFRIARYLLSRGIGIKMESTVRIKIPHQATSKRVECAVAEASNRFGINLYYLLAEENTNVLFSPFSLSTASAMLYCGARNETAEEMREVLGYEAANIEDTELTSGFQKIICALGSPQEFYTLKCANAVLIHRELSVKDEYKSLLEDNFEALFQEADFVKENEESVKLVNKWVNEKTDSMIPKILNSLDPLTVMIFLNAVYFKGFWEHQFKEQYTNLQDFCNKGDKNKRSHVEMMHIKYQFPYTKQESYKALQLPYKGRGLSMLILLPDSEDGLSELENSLSSTFVHDLEQSMSTTYVELALPKFKLEYSKSLKEKFQSLGLNRVFDIGAHLDDINDSDELFLSEVNHKAVLVVNEEGTKAIAVTGEIIQGSREPMKEAKFIVDHPFMFVIYNIENNLIIFMGRVVEL